jgi:hypothetical protein
MYYILRHGFKKPTKNNLVDFQLGWSSEEKALFIKDPEKEEPIQPVINDKVIQDFIEHYIAQIDSAAKTYFRETMVDTSKVLRNTYERNVVYTVSYDYDAKEGEEAPADIAGRDYYSITDKDKAVEQFIKDWADDIDAEGAKVVLTDNKVKNVYFYIIIRDEEDKLVGKFVTTLETSLQNMRMEYDNMSNSIIFSIAGEVINTVSLANMKLDCGSWD